MNIYIYMGECPIGEHIFFINVNWVCVIWASVLLVSVCEPIPPSSVSSPRVVEARLQEASSPLHWDKGQLLGSLV